MYLCSISVTNKWLHDNLISLLCLLEHCRNSLSFIHPHLSPRLSIMYTWNFRLNMMPDKNIKWEIWGKMHYWKGRQGFSWNQQKGLDGSNGSRKLSADIWRPSREKNRFKEMMETLIRDRCHINCTINVSPGAEPAVRRKPPATSCSRGLQ